MLMMLPRHIRMKELHLLRFGKKVRGMTTQMTTQRQAGWKTKALLTEPESKSWNAGKREFQLGEMQGSNTRKQAKRLTNGWNAGEKEKRQDR